jgi:hypothetical protein
MAGWGSLSSYDKSWYTLHTVFFVPESTKDRKNAKPAMLYEYNPSPETVNPYLRLT